MSYSLRKSRRILRNGYRIFQKKGNTLSKPERETLESDLRRLDQAALAKNKSESSEWAKKVETTIHHHFPKSLLDHLREVVYALGFAIIVAFLIRQFWFELYEVPTGSMRPTVEELDRMVVSKSTFGITVPFRNKPLLYSDDFLQRASTIVFTVAGMDVSDSNMLYFGLIPGKKRYIKRCVAKPGDTIYFYGGLIYGIDQDGNPLMDQADPNFLQENGIEKIDHIPFISMNGKPLLSQPAAPHVYTSTIIRQMNIPVAQLEIKGKGQVEGKFFNGQEWVQERLEALKAPREIPVSYSDLWGIGNYAQARLLTRAQVQAFYGTVSETDAVAYLELHHTPNLTYPKPEIRQGEIGYFQPMLNPFTAIIPLKQTHLNAIQHSLYTARFYVQNGRAYRYHEGNGRPQRPEYDPKFQNVPNGCYEFYYGVGYKVHTAGILTRLPENHPLYDSSVENIMKLFNLGMSFNSIFDPVAAYQPYTPQRFAYYRGGDLFVMGAPILKKTDPTLIRFIQSETEKQNESSRDNPYIAFIDRGAPLNENGELDVDFIRAFGLKVPQNRLVALGDNYAMSADSRDFGFVPTANLRGAPSFTFWPPSKRLGPLPQPPYPWLTLPNLIVWTVVAIVILLTILWIIRRNNRSVFKK
jgi:signal peptidase I